MTKRLTIALIALVALVLVAVLPVSATYADVNNTINLTATVYIGEQQLNITPAEQYWTKQAKVVPQQLGWWASAASVSSTSPSATFNLNSTGTANPDPAVYISSAAFGTSVASGNANWYVVNPPGTLNAGFGNTTFGAFFTVADPGIVVDVWDLSTGTTVTNGKAIQGDFLAFRINTNLQSAINSPALRTNDVAADAAVSTGNMDIKVKSASGNTYTSLYTNNATTPTWPITAQNVTTAVWFWGTKDGQTPGTSNVATAPNWSSDAMLPSGQNAYPAGVYTVIAQSRLNGMYDNYLNGGATYTGKTISQPATVTISSNTVALAANVNSVVRSKPFSVTITGKPYQVYHLWIKGTNTMDGSYNNQPPYITPNQAGVVFDPVTVGYVTAPAESSPYTPFIDNGGYTYQNGVLIWNNVAHGNGFGTSADTATPIGNGTYLYANVSLDQTGTRTVQFSTTNWTKAQQYTVRVEQDFGTSGAGVTQATSNHNYKYDEVTLTVQLGAVTIQAAGNGAYYLGEVVQFSGTNTESPNTYLYITGPNLATAGAQFSNAPAQNPVTNGNPNTFQQVSVLGDNTWSWQWATNNVAIDAGTYTVYAVSQPMDSAHLSNVAYGTVSIILKAPFVSATASQSTLAAGDPLYITGTAQGQPSTGVNIWILGTNYAYVGTQSVNSDSSFSYEVMPATTSTLATGQYFVVVQHPMENGVFDVQAVPAPQNTYSGQSNAGQKSVVYTDSPTNPGIFPQMQNGVPNLQNFNGTSDFTLTGQNALQGTNAAQALITAINSPNVDDSYTKLQFLVETPVITVTPIGDHSVGDKFTITGTTNLAVGDNVLFTVRSSSFQPTDKTQGAAFAGASGTVQVTQGTNGLNAISFPVDASTFKPDEYLVTATSVGLPNTNQAVGTALFTVTQATAPTATPTTVASGVTTAPSQMPTVVQTTVAPAKTPTQPGFGALVALIGLGAVALLVVRRH